MRIEWTVEAASELSNILSYLSEKDPGAAALVAGRVFAAEDRIRRFPKGGRHDVETDTYDQFIPKTRIVLTYAVRKDVIWIVTTWHTSRDPNAKPVRS